MAATNPALQVTTFADLFTSLQNKVRVQTSVTATENQAKAMINTALYDMHIGNGEKFPWAERKGVLQTMKPYSTGTVAITKGSTALAGTSTAWDTAHDFGANNTRTTGKMTVNGTVNVYTISAVTDDTNIVLNERYQDTTETSGSYTYYEDEYDLASDFLRPFDLQYFDTNQAVNLINRREFRQRYPRNKTPGKITHATIVDRAFGSDTTPVRRVIFRKPPDDYYLVPYNYITANLAVTSAGVEQAQMTNDDDEPIVPLRYRHAIVLHALYHWYRDKKNDTRSQEAKGEYTDIIIRMTADSEIGSVRPQITPRMGAYKRTARSPYSRTGRRHTLGSAFDERRE